MLLHRCLALLFASAMPSSALRDRAFSAKYTRSNVTSGQSNNTTTNGNSNITSTPILMDPLSLSQYTADEVIKLLNLSIRAEGGYFRQTSEDSDKIFGDNSSFSAPIYYLIRGEDGYTRYHIKDAQEVWYYYAGAPLAMVQVKSYKKKDGTSDTTISALGPNIFEKQLPTIHVEKNTWHKEISAGKWTLVKIIAWPDFLQGEFRFAREGCEPVIENCL
ncbi:hypothetical protein E4U40_003622 [Claviceps sp. LM458 group G5]|nr:hypothetical protein E4U40_003622 [Claviceps sp. LM458 group G5]